MTGAPGDRRECARGCGLASTPGPIARHERTCWSPKTIERLYEIGRVDTSGEECWEWSSIDGGESGWYPRIKQQKVSQLVCALVHGPREEESHRPLHACDNVRCVRGSHLRWGTQAENVQDLYDHGRR